MSRPRPALSPRNLTHDAVIVGKSTVPVGTGARLRAIVADAKPEGISAEVVWNPEFLREGKAVDDTLSPDRLVFGGASPHAEAVLREVYATPIANGTPVLVADLPTAELVKVSANAFLATKISFINAISEICDAAGADVSLLADALGHDAQDRATVPQRRSRIRWRMPPQGHPRTDAPLKRARRALGGRSAAAGG